MSTITQASKQTTVDTVIQQGGISIHRSRVLWGWIFLSPWIFGLIAFTLLPMIISLMFTFTDFDLNNPGATNLLDFSSYDLDNYRKLTNDPNVGTSLRTTLIFMALALPFSIVIPLTLAVLLNSKNLWGKVLFRTLFYMPFIVPTVSAVGIWNGYLNQQSGWLDKLLEVFGIAGPDWTNSLTWIYPALLLIGIWGSGNAMLVMLAGMQGVPTELYEAATVDGAGAFARFRSITLPMISPVIFYNLVLASIGLFRYFDVPYMLKQGTGDPGNATLFYNIHFYKEAFTFQNMGYGATLAWFLFLLAFIFTIVLFWSARYWVYYAGGDERA